CVETIKGHCSILLSPNPQKNL
ncbi:hypothetical protein GWI33_003779, partial [Rhynchophorus ferrugineus]